MYNTNIGIFLDPLWMSFQKTSLRSYHDYIFAIEIPTHPLIALKLIKRLNFPNYGDI